LEIPAGFRKFDPEALMAYQAKRRVGRTAATLESFVAAAIAIA
jgi:hypothetical protein